MAAAVVHVVMSLSTAAHAAADDPVILRGLKHSAEGRALVEEAISSTNLMTSTDSPKLVPSWKTRGVDDETPVYLVTSLGSAAATPAAVPKDCTCIFVNVPVLKAWVARHSTGDGRLSLDVRYVLTFMLLHEVGHLRQKTAGADFQDGELVQLNIDPSVAKAKEEDADQFAAQLIREKARATPVSSTSIEANWVANELVKLSWNMQAYRTLDEFGSFATGRPSVYFDQGYSHPNLAWRVLRSNVLIQQSPETEFLLEAFEEARRRGANPRPLYQRK